MSPDVASVKRGIGGRIEESFAAAKAAGRAAFVTFVTAGYPRSEGAFVLGDCMMFGGGYDWPDKERYETCLGDVIWFSIQSISHNLGPFPFVGDSSTSWVTTEHRPNKHDGCIFE